MTVWEAYIMSDDMIKKEKFIELIELIRALDPQEIIILKAYIEGMQSSKKHSKTKVQGFDK